MLLVTVSSLNVNITFSVGPQKQINGCVPGSQHCIQGCRKEIKQFEEIVKAMGFYAAFGIFIEKQFL